MPFLCAYLVWQKLREWRGRAGGSLYLEDPDTRHGKPHLLIALALTFFALRLIQQANPEWRLVSWGFGLFTLMATFSLLPFFLKSVSRPWLSVGSRMVIPCADGRIPPSRLFRFPLAFILVAVPWPTVVEQPLIQMLTRCNAALTTEFLNALDVPALRHGNVIEVGSGVVGIERAAAALDHFQATSDDLVVSW